MRVVFLDWLADPDPGRGIYVADHQEGWNFQSYADLAVDVQRAAVQLSVLGLSPGEVVSLLVFPPRDFVVAFLGTMLAGGTPSPIATPISFRDRTQYVAHVAGILRAADPAVLLADDLLSETATEASACAGRHRPVTRFAPDRDHDAELGDLSRWRRRRPEDVALLQFTSGSSGHPKGVRVSWENLDSNIRAIRRWLSWADADSFASWLPVYHDMGLIGGILTPVASRADLWLMTPDQFLRSPLRWLECFGRGRATMTTAPSFGYAYAAKRVQPENLDGLDFSGWRVAILGAERIDPAAIARFTALLGPKGFAPSALVPGYGLAEVTLAVSGADPRVLPSTVRLTEATLQLGAEVEFAERGQLGVDPGEGRGWLTGCGRPLEGIAVRIVGEQGEPLAEGRFGEIVVSGSSLAQGYRTEAGETDFPRSGLATGDAGFLLDGQLYVMGRIGDSLKVRGRSVYAEDVEAELVAIPGVRPGRCAAVFGSVNGIDVAAAVVEDETAAWRDDVAALLRGVTGESVRVVVLRGARGSIPRTSSGKARRRVMWGRLTAGQLDWELVFHSGDRQSEPLPWSTPVGAEPR